MTLMPGAHRNSRGWNRLRNALAIGALILAPVFFAVMFISVKDLVRPSFHDLSWTVPVATEGCFALMYCLDILMTWASKPMPSLRAVPYLFAALSLWLNIRSAGSDTAGMVGHAAVTLAFFIPMIAFESAVRRLSVTALAEGLADARQYAIDLCRSEKGIAWRYRAPSLLRRQLLSGRLPDEVRSDVTLKVSMGRTSGWEDTVRAWVFRELAIDVTAQVASRKAVASITAEPVPAALPDVAPAAAETRVRTAAKPAAGTASEPASETTPKLRPKLTARRSRAMSPAALEPWVSDLLDEDPTLSMNQVIAELHVGRQKASEALRLARKNRMSSAVGSR